MKATKYIMIAAAALAFTACEDFMSTNSPSAMGEEYVFSSPERCEQAVAGVYELFGKNNGYRNRLACGFQGLNTDIEHSTYSTSDKAEQKATALYAMTPTNSQVSNANNNDIWSYLNVGIERCNNIIEGIEKFGQRNEKDELEKKTSYYLGEAHFLRAFHYLEMVKYWGDVPLRYHSLSTAPEEAANPKTDRNEVYEFIRADLKAAVELLPWSNECPANVANSIERPSKAAAYALLARADLMYAGYSVRPDQLVPGGTAACSVRLNLDDASKRKDLYKEALDACKEIIAKEDGKLLTNYEQVFRLLCADNTDYSKMEHIWVMPFASGNRGQFLNYNCPKLTGSDQKDGLNGVLPNFKASCSTSSVQTVSPIMVFEFEKGDKRKFTTFVPGVWYNNTAMNSALPEGANTAGANLYEKAQKVDKFYLGKYRVEWMVHDHVATDDGVDFPIIRYADVLLMAAEATIGGVSGDVPDGADVSFGLAQLNKVRSRAGLPNASKLDMDAIMHERACELCGEYVRKWDLMRWGVFEKKMKEARAKLDKMATPEGRAELGIADAVYYKFKAYKFNENDTQVAYVMDRETILGLSANEELPEGFDSSEWQKTEIYVSGDDKEEILGSAKYPLYEREEYLTTHQYWPIFSVNVGISNGALWNDYGYDN